MVFPDRVLYARKAGEDVAGTSVDSGEKITLEIASVRSISLYPGVTYKTSVRLILQALKELAWGSANMPPKSEWLKAGLTFHPAEGLFAYGFKTPKNGTKNFLLCVQAYLLKHLLFEKRARTNSQRYGGST